MRPSLAGFGNLPALRSRFERVRVLGRDPFSLGKWLKRRWSLRPRGCCPWVPAAVGSHARGIAAGEQWQRGGLRQHRSDPGESLPAALGSRAPCRVLFGGGGLVAAGFWLGRRWALQLLSLVGGECALVFSGSPAADSFPPHPSLCLVLALFTASIVALSFGRPGPFLPSSFICLLLCTLPAGPFALRVL